MKHNMKIKDNPYQHIKNGTKTIELRLYDEKRRKIKENDIIEFTNVDNGENVSVEVIKLHFYNNFIELYKNFDKISLGYEESENSDPRDMNKYYSIEEQEKYGVVGIEIKLIKK